MFIRQKLLKRKYTDSATDIFLLCARYIFIWFSRSAGFEGNNKYNKKGI